MIKTKEITKGIWTFQMFLPNCPLDYLNCYVIKGENGGRNLLIDTGFHLPECLNTLLEGMAALGLRFEDTDVIITHFHTDHAGNAQELQNRGCRILMGDFEYHVLNFMRDDGRDYLEGEGIPMDIVSHVFYDNPENFILPVLDAVTLKAGSVISYNEYNLELIHTPGHTPGHICLYDREHKLMFTGDHVLFDIYPFITMGKGGFDSLGRYLESLKSLRELDVELALPAHRGNKGIDFKTRINQILLHHKNQIDRILRTLNNNPGMNAFQLAPRMSLGAKAEIWDSIPPDRQFYIFTETLATLSYMTRRGQILREKKEGKDAEYFPVD